jgi:hypothetical protein
LRQTTQEENEMLTVTIRSYDEYNDTFSCSARDSQLDTDFEIDIPGLLIPYIAPQAIEFEDPHDMVGMRFVLK